MMSSAALFFMDMKLRKVTLIMSYIWEMEDPMFLP